MLMNPTTPLRYKISSWRQLPYCLSNNNRQLKIHVTDLMNNDLLRGFKITVEHPAFGVLFACVLEAHGELVTDVEEYSVQELSVATIINELARYGFLITYAPNEALSGPQLQYLMTLENLGYDKIRILNTWKVVHGLKEFNTKVVAFQSDPLGDWLNNGYSPSETEFVDALNIGTAINLTDMSKTRQFRWDWLKDFVGSIHDIIEDNADDNIKQPEVYNDEAGDN